MAIDVATLRATLVADTNRFSSAMRGADDDVDRFASNSKSKFGSMAKAGVAAASLLVVKFGVDAVKAFSEAEKVAAQTVAVLKSTGRAANVTARDVSKLAESLSKMSGVDDEAIQSGENLLLTFTKVRNEVGKGNKIFDQATAVMLDMSVALGQDMKSSAIQVGKALNDPIKGMSALQRVGVSFTKGQKDQIEALVKSGNVMGAQKVILKELRTEFGGSAKAAGSTFAGQVDKLKNAFGNLQEKVGAFLVDALMKIPGVIADVNAWLKQHQDTIDDVQTAVSDFGDLVTTVWEAIEPVVVDALKGAGQALKGFGTALAGILKTITSLLHGDFREAWEGVKQIFSGALTNIAGILRTFTAPFRAAAKTVGNAIIDGIESLAGAFVAVGKWVVNRIADGVTTLTEALGAVGGWIKNRIVDGIQATAGAFVAAGTWIVNRVADGVTTITGALASVGGWIKNRVVEGVQAMGGALSAAGEWVIDKIAEGAKAFGAAFYNIGKNILNSMVNGIKAGASSVVGAIKGVVSGAINEAKGLLGIRSPSKVFAQFGRQTVAGFAQGLAADPRAVMRGLQTGMFDPLAAGMSSSSVGSGGGITSAPRIASGSGGGVGGNTYNLVVQSLDPQQAATAVIRAIDQFERVNGTRFARA